MLEDQVSSAKPVTRHEVFEWKAYTAGKTWGINTGNDGRVEYFFEWEKLTHIYPTAWLKNRLPELSLSPNASGAGLTRVDDRFGRDFLDTRRIHQLPHLTGRSIIGQNTNTGMINMSAHAAVGRRWSSKSTITPSSHHIKIFQALSTFSGFIMMFATFLSTTTAEEIATALADEMKGKNVLITGTSLNGMGFEAARTIAKHAKPVVITCHNTESLLLSSLELFPGQAAIKPDFPSANIRPITIMDLFLSPLPAPPLRKRKHTYPEPLQVHPATSGPNQQRSRANRAFQAHRRPGTQIATGYPVDLFLFTKLIAPQLLAARTTSLTSHVVYVSSVAHTIGSGVDFATLVQPGPETYTNFGAYMQVCNIFENRLAGFSLVSLRTHHGMRRKEIYYELENRNILVRMERKHDIHQFKVGEDGDKDVTNGNTMPEGRVWMGVNCWRRRGGERTHQDAEQPTYKNDAHEDSTHHEVRHVARGGRGNDAHEDIIQHETRHVARGVSDGNMHDVGTIAMSVEKAGLTHPGWNDHRHAETTTDVTRESRGKGGPVRHTKWHSVAMGLDGHTGEAEVSLPLPAQVFLSFIRQVPSDGRKISPRKLDIGAGTADNGDNSQRGPSESSDTQCVKCSPSPVLGLSFRRGRVLALGRRFRVSNDCKRQLWKGMKAGESESILSRAAVC
ncbi:hypothetical protein DFH09DRAFT_1086066 [Mycena vulgaris]|nr:hypothetical protein DFH09DRAFT_1086066 [Mycena vulgaris]